MQLVLHSPFPFVPRTGLEPMTYCLEGSCSIQLSYRGVPYFAGAKIEFKSQIPNYKLQIPKNSRKRKIAYSFINFSYLFHIVSFYILDILILSFKTYLKQVNSVYFTLTYHFIGPDTGLNFANMCFAQEIHTQPRLAYSTSYSKR